MGHDEPYRVEVAVFVNFRMAEEVEDDLKLGLGDVVEHLVENVNQGLLLVHSGNLVSLKQVLEIIVAEEPPFADLAD